ncbi:MAG: hypothetical protein OXI67_19400 [Candidatus Poribacteria bacterium]|nr:hypothetical protein [Candidatus Poribacteria bacterium]
MTPNDVKELLKTIIAAECLPIEIIDIAPTQNLLTSDSTTENRIKDVIHQWNKDGKIYTRHPGRSDIMEFYSKTDSESAAKELLESLAVEALLEVIIAEQELSICFTDHGFRLVTLAEDDTTRYPVKILHGGFQLEKKQEAKVLPTQLEGVANRFEMLLKEKRIKAKLFHRGFRLEKTSEANIPLSKVDEIAKRIDDILGINYVLDSYNTPPSEEVFKSTSCTSANIRISLWRFPRREWKS